MLKKCLKNWYYIIGVIIVGYIFIVIVANSFI